MILLSRDEFRETVFKRDENKCVICNNIAQDAHHIIERRLWNDGGYYIGNGVSLCGKCHILAEQTVISCDELRKAAKINKVIIPQSFYSDEKYTKWGDVILPNNTRVKGELFEDPSVQKILSEGNMINLYTKLIKYPKTYHLPWSEGVDEKTGDRLLTEECVSEMFNNKEVVVTEKCDGENSSLYSDYLHARSIDGRDHPSRSWLKKSHSIWKNDIPESWRICGENLYAEHSIHYKNLPSYFLVFSIWNEKNECLSWDETIKWNELIDLVTVPVLYRGVWDIEKIKKCFTGKSIFEGSEQEGYVVRITDGFRFSEFRKSVAKFVRKNHVTSAHNWMNRKVIQNELKTA